MAAIMMAFMLGMYTNRRANAAIFIGSVLVFAGLRLELLPPAAALERYAIRHDRIRDPGVIANRLQVLCDQRPEIR